MYKFKIYCLLFLLILLVACIGCNNLDANKQDTPSINSTQTNPTQTITKKNDITVYTTPTGKRFHLKSTCAGKNAIKTFLSEVEDSFTPCKKCTK